MTTGQRHQLNFMTTGQRHQFNFRTTEQRHQLSFRSARQRRQYNTAGQTNQNQECFWLNVLSHHHLRSSSITSIAANTEDKNSIRNEIKSKSSNSKKQHLSSNNFPQNNPERLGWAKGFNTHSPAILALHQPPQPQDKTPVAPREQQYLITEEWISNIEKNNNLIMSDKTTTKRWRQQQ